MQVEHKTEKGTVLFVKVPEDASDSTLPKAGIIDLYFQTKVKSECEEDNYISIPLPDLGFKLIGLTSEITEDQAELMVHAHVEDNGNIYGYFDYPQSDTIKNTALGSFKTLMQNLQVYDVNPLPDPEDTMRQGDGYVYYVASDDEFEEYENINNKCGKWVVLFKEN